MDCPKNAKQELECPSNTATSFTWISKNPDIKLISDPIDVVFSGLGSAKQRTKTIPNPNYDKNATTDMDVDPPINPKTIEEVVPLTFTLCHSKLGESRTILIAQNGTVEGLNKGTC